MWSHGRERVWSLLLLKFISIYFLAALGLHRHTQAFSRCSERALLCCGARGLLTAAASFVVENRL